MLHPCQRRSIIKGIIVIVIIITIILLIITLRPRPSIPPQLLNSLLPIDERRRIHSFFQFLHVAQRRCLRISDAAAFDDNRMCRQRASTVQSSAETEANYNTGLRAASTAKKTPIYRVGRAYTHTHTHTHVPTHTHTTTHTHINTNTITHTRTRYTLRIIPCDDRRRTHAFAPQRSTEARPSNKDFSEVQC